MKLQRMLVATCTTVYTVQVTDTTDSDFEDSEDEMKITKGFTVSKCKIIK